MSELENTLAGLLSTIDFTPSEHHPELMLPMAYTLLSLLDSSPTKFEAMMECPECKDWPIQPKEPRLGFSSPCILCGNTREIVRPMAQKEVMELPGMILDNIALVVSVKTAFDKGYIVDIGAKMIIYLPSGERVRIQEKK